MVFGFLGPSADIDITLSDENTRRKVEVLIDDGVTSQCCLYYNGESISGTLDIMLKKSKLEHQGVRVEFIGQLEIFYGRGSLKDFLTLRKELATPGVITESVKLPFTFANVEKPYESYSGYSVKLRYFLRAIVVQRMANMVREIEIAVQNLSPEPVLNPSVTLNVGVNDLLSVEIEYNHTTFHLHDVIVGRVYFMQVGLKLKVVELTVVRIETVRCGTSNFENYENVGKYEIVDGSPYKGETIPVRIFLAGYNLTPTMTDVCQKFTVKYMLNMIFIDDCGRQYYKEQDIVLYRRPSPQIPNLKEASPENASNAKLLNTVPPASSEEAECTDSE
ncbi:unnamed protein product [Caenorhabditis bovis]|uniref:Vacuolar protein sorting-associated protein 26 n=1 Tax=Caenorhabditis bovis TaxID=2654633 RepID=A0A8S1F9E0_9PELO|nr:unnamed protein product [Caenorhabditis bovis]